MTDVVPPGGERPPDQEPWPGEVRADPLPAQELPLVPAPPPADVETPDDWRTMAAAAEMPPAGYQTGTGPPLYNRTRADRWGILSCLTGLAGLGQLAIVYVPVLSAIGVAFALAGRRFGALDPHGVRGRGTSNVGLALGGLGVLAGALLRWRYGTFTSIVDI